MKNLMMGCAVVGLIALSPRYEARSPDLPVLVPAQRRSEPTVQPTAPRAQVGWASWYGSERQGSATASGEVFDQNGLTAAHRNLPFGTMVRVTNLRNRQSSLLRITDRGPWPGGRVIDVSWAAAKELGFLQVGLARVEVQIVSYPQTCLRHLSQLGTLRPN